MTTGNEADPRDDALAKAWRAQSQDLPPSALDATILAAAHRAVGSGPRDARKQATEATRPQRWWMPLAAAATIGVVVIGILQIAPQAPVDIVVGERAEVAVRVAPVVPTAPAKDAAQGSVVATLKDVAPAKNVGDANAVAPTTTAPATAVPAAVAREQKAAANVAPAPSPPAARRQVAVAPSIPAPEPFPADKLSSKVDAQSTTRQDERKDAAEAPRAPMVAQSPVPPVAPAAAMMAPAPMKKESMGSAAGSVTAADSAAKPAGGARERDAARDETSARNAPAVASPELARGTASPTDLPARSTASPTELQARARDPDAWIARIRKLRADGRFAEAVAELREFRRYVPDAESRLPADLREFGPLP